MQTFRERSWLRTLTRKPLRRVPFRAIVRQWWSVYGETVRHRVFYFFLGVFLALFWVATLMLADYITAMGAM